MQRSHQVAIWTFLSGVFVLSGVVCASAEEILIRRFGTRVECDEPDSHHSWSWAQRAKADRQCQDASRGLIKRRGNHLDLQFGGRHLAKYSDAQSACIDENYDKCSYARVVSFSLNELFVVVSVNSGLENLEYLFIGLSSGIVDLLGGRPEFSPSGREFIVFSDAYSDMSEDFVIYRVELGKLIRVAEFPPNKVEGGHIWDLVQWSSEDEILIKTQDYDPVTRAAVEVTATVRRTPDGTWTLIGWPIR